MTQQHGDEAFEAIVAPLAAERAAATEGTVPNADWSLNGFGELYVSERDRLLAIANRYLHDPAEAEDVVQDAFLKCAMAAPELANRDHAVAYLTRTVVNTALNVVRAGTRRAEPVEDLTTANLDSREIDAWDPAADEAVMRAADTALVTEALSRLTDQQRLALLLTASGEYSTKQVAEQLGVSEQQVYTHVSRARAALRRALENIVVDAETGMTAADQLSTVMKKAKTNARQIGQGLAALALVFAVGLGFWNWTSAPTASQLLQQVGAGAQQQPAQPAAPQATMPAAPQSTAPSTPAANPTAGTTKPAAAPAPTTKATATQKAAASLPTVSANELRAATLPKVTEVIPGTDTNGVPQGFLVADQTGVVGEGTVNTESTGITKAGTIVTTSDFITVRNGVNVMLHQTLTWASGKLAYKVSPMVRVNGEWRDLPIASQATEQSDLADGSALITTHILVDTTAASTAIAGPGFGVDAQHLPAMLVVRIHTSSSGYPVFGEVVQVIDPLQVAH